jgi:hypothetical protein
LEKAAGDGRTKQSGAPPDSVRCAATSSSSIGLELVDRWRLCPHVAPDSLVRHRTVRCPSDQLLCLLPRSLCCTVHCQSRPLRADDRCSTGAPDSPVNYSGAAPGKPEGEEFEVNPPWCTGQCPVAHWTVRCARPGSTSVSYAPFFLNPFNLYIGFELNLWHL